MGFGKVGFQEPLAESCSEIFGEVERNFSERSAIHLHRDWHGQEGWQTLDPKRLDLGRRT